MTGAVVGSPNRSIPFVAKIARTTARRVPSEAAIAASSVIQSSDGFSWPDGAIGLAAGIGVALSGAAAVGLTRRSPQPAN